MTRTTKTLQALAALGLVTTSLATASTGCLNRPIDRLEPRTTSTVVERLTQSAVDKIDLLLAIDNSASMADKQAILADAVPDLVDRLVQPICVNIETGDPDPAGSRVDAAGECATGLKPEFPPIKDINIGIITSSLGALTANQCDGGASADPTDNDKGRLVTRAGTGGMAQTYQGKGFLAWDPGGVRGGTTDAAALKTTLTDMVVGVGQVGCGYEMQLESVYRFLADPDPYESLTATGENRLQENGTDQIVLQQRADFMRANSLLAILILTDENDCSVDITGQGYLALGTNPFWRATEECATDPNNECCTSCALGNPAGCGADASCGAAQGSGGATKYTQLEDQANLRCFEQKRRYGVDFLYPVQRYVNAFQQVSIDPTKPDLAVSGSGGLKNPIFSDLSGAGVAVRDPGLVFVAGIVGVPWQYLARGCAQGEQCPGAPPNLNFGFKTFNELAQEKATDGSPLLDALIGDPDGHIPPGDVFMKESIAKRSGTSIIVAGESLPGTNNLNRGDRNIDNIVNDDLQYTCIFDLEMPNPTGFDCEGCDTEPLCDDPLCNPANKSEQVAAKAYPGLRELALLRGMQDQGIFASICPAETQDLTAANYGYRPAVGAIIDRLKQELGGQCLPRKLTVNPETGLVPCLVLEATVTDNCGCDESAGRRAIASDSPYQNAIKAAEEDEFNPGWNCFCEIIQLTEASQQTCQNDDVVDNSINGWCYVDATPPGPVGNPQLVADCPADEKRLVRFVNKGLPQPGATVFVTCTGDAVE